MVSFSAGGRMSKGVECRGERIVATKNKVTPIGQQSYIRTCRTALVTRDHGRLRHIGSQSLRCR